MTSIIYTNPYLPGCRDEFIKDNFGLVRKISSKFYRARFIYTSSIEKDDIFQVGCMGLLHAYNKYNGHGAFSTYAHYCIRGYILKLLNETNNGLYFSVPTKKLATKILKFDLMKYTPLEMSSYLNVAVHHIEAALEYIANGTPVSMHTKISKDGSDVTNAVLSDTFVDLHQNSANWDDDIELQAFISTLGHTHKTVLDLLVKGYTTRQVATGLNLTQQRVSKIWQQILEKAVNFRMGVVKSGRGRPKKNIAV